MTYIFDFDGTLVDSMPVFAENILKIFDEHQLNYPEDVIKIITPLGYKGTAQYAVSLGYDDSVDTFIQIAINHMIYAYHNTIPLKQSVKEKLVQLHRQGNSLNILTASPHAFLDQCLKRLAIDSLFDNIWSCDDFAYTKADVALYETVADRLGKNTSDCQFIDDNVFSIRTAKNAGMMTVGVYDKSSEDYIAEMKTTADRYIYSFAEL